MCIRFICEYCNVPTLIECADEVEGEVCPYETVNPDFGRPTHCNTCSLVISVTLELNALIFREPWLNSVGMSGAPPKQPWELQGIRSNDNHNYDESDDEDDDDGMSKEQRREFRAQSQRSLMESWGLKIMQEEAHGNVQATRDSKSSGSKEVEDFGESSWETQTLANDNSSDGNDSS